ncbi:cobalt-precorrin 5A hydrolase [Tissierella creatinini]|nr:cobalt-precorrin 5A hydrolase [Tissierella creatinini]TJX65618.1 cobalt-precorrin 5A hydrolase [Soehngenia saccharolytica]
MKIACLSFTDKGFLLGERISAINSTIYTIDHFANSKLESGVGSFLKKYWSLYDGFIFISATGIAIRMINPYIESKTKDPAIVVVDDMGKYSISLLSGHLGGANEMAKVIGENIGAISVITTSSDNRGIDSLDIFAKRNNLHMENMDSITKITAMMVNEKKIGLYSEILQDLNYNHLEIVEDLNSIDRSLDGIIIISSKVDLGTIPIPYTVLRPKNINIGIGCRKGIEAEEIIKAITVSLMNKNLSINSVKAMGTIEVKKNEIGIIKASEHFKCPLKIYSIEDIKEIEDMFQKSQFVKDTIGVYSVSEPCAYLLGGELITGKARYNGVTISITRVGG